MSRKNPRFRFCKVSTIIPSSSIVSLMQDHHLEHKMVVKSISDILLTNRKNSDDNTSLIQKDIARVETLLERVLCFSIVSILLSCIILICC